MKLTDDMHIEMVDRGGVMGVPHIGYVIADDEKLQIIEINSKERWISQQHCKEF